MTARGIRLRTVGLALGAAGLLATTVGVAWAADLGKEVAMAERHASLAAGSSAVNMVHTHLHHVINCLVGPKGAGFDSNALNPCASLGNGILPDTTDAAKKKIYDEALAKAEAGLKMSDLKAAQHQATAVAATLKSGM